MGRSRHSSEVRLVGREPPSPKGESRGQHLISTCGHRHMLQLSGNDRDAAAKSTRVMSPRSSFPARIKSNSSGCRALFSCSLDTCRLSALDSDDATRCPHPETCKMFFSPKTLLTSALSWPELKWTFAKPHPPIARDLDVADVD